jgi:hypothetical protein
MLHVRAQNRLFRKDQYHGVFEKLPHELASTKSGVKVVGV